MPRLCALLTGTMVLLPATVFAHTGHVEVSGLQSGLSHPIHGLDHVLAMLAVGMLGTQLGGRMIWGLPMVFMGVLLAGVVLALAGVALPAVEIGIVLSVVVLGVLLASGRSLPQSLALALAALFAVFHGHAHGAEMPFAANGIDYGLGFLITTATLHAAGIGFGLGLISGGERTGLRLAGLAIVVLGLGFAVA